VLVLDQSVRHEREAIADRAVVLTIASPVDESAPHVTDARGIDRLLEELATVQRGCIACHNSFRDRLRTTAR
jgi:cytochrome c556